MLRRSLLLCLSSVFLLAFAPSSAFAHHATVTATVDCGGSVAYTVTSWSTPDEDHRINNSVNVTVGGAAAGSGALTAANGYAFSGSFQLTQPLPASVTVNAAYGAFGASGEYGSAGTASTGALTVPPCPTQPTGSIADISCSSGGALATLGNTGGGTATIRITKDGAVVEDVAVGAGATETRLVPIAEDTTATITLSSGGSTLASRTLSANCNLAPAVPSATIADIDCATGGALVSLGNTGEETATFTVTAAGATVATVPVVGGATASQVVPITENATTTITVTAPGLATVTRTVMRDCVAPAAPGAVIGGISCTDGGAYVIVTNTGGEATTFTITVGGAVLDTLVVTGGARATRLVPIAEDTTAAIVVTAPNLTTVSAQVARDCTPAAPAPTPPAAANTAAPDAALNTPMASEADSLGNAAGAVDAVGVTELTPVLDAVATAGVSDVAADATDELPFTGTSDLRALLVGGFLALLLGVLLPVTARRAERRARTAARD